MTDLPENYRPVLDKGYVGLLGVHGSDRGVVSPPSAARTSFKKQASEFTEEQNDRLTHYLMKKSEFACFRHNVMSFEIRMPLFVARQFWKYVVASNWTSDQLGWNENSKRYITEANEFYIPHPGDWRKAADNKKQGSSGPVDWKLGEELHRFLKRWTEEGEEIYQRAVELGVAPEQARLFTSNGNYVTVQWTTSLNALLHFLDERLDSHAQYEIVQYAKVVEVFFKDSFPVVHKAWTSSRQANQQLKLEAESFKDVVRENEALKEEIEALRARVSESNRPWFKKIFV